MPALAPLANPEDVEQRLGRDLSPTEEARLEAVLIDASAAVRNYTGRTFTLSEHTARIRARRGRVRLPQRPVVSIVSVKALNLDGTVGSTLAGWMFDGLDSLDLASLDLVINATTPERGRQVVEVAYTAGYKEIPDAVVAVVCSVALRALGRQPLEGGLTSESIDGYSYSVGSAGAAGPLGMLPDERAVLDSYRLPAGPIHSSR